jgi:hypothetical protein
MPERAQLLMRGTKVNSLKVELWDKPESYAPANRPSAPLIERLLGPHGVTLAGLPFEKLTPIS